MRRSPEGGEPIESEMAVRLRRRGIRSEGQARGALVELQFDGIRTIDSRLVDRSPGNGTRMDPRPIGDRSRSRGTQGERNVRRARQSTHNTNHGRLLTV